MNFYQHHIGDFNNATRHLTRIERSIYRDLLELYYDSETPLTGDLDRLARRCLVEGDHREAMRLVLEEFFELQEDGWHNDRADREIAVYREKSVKARSSAMLSVASRSKKNSHLRADRMSAAKEKGTHTKEEWAALVEFCGDQCVRCGANGHLDKDHIKPLYQGGSHSIENLQPLCPTCNSSKGPEDIDHRPEGWREHVESKCSTSAQRTLNDGSANHNHHHNHEPSPETKEKTEAQGAPVAASGDVALVFEFWKTTMKSPRSQLDVKRGKLIKAALKTGYTAEQLCDAITGCAKSPFHMGDNDRRAKYNGLDLILRNAEKIDQFIVIGQSPHVPKRQGFTHDLSQMDYSKGVDEHGNF